MIEKGFYFSKIKTIKLKLILETQICYKKQGLVDKKKDLINSPPKDAFYFSAVRSKNN